jgi:hypothetical protein
MMVVPTCRLEAVITDEEQLDGKRFQTSFIAIIVRIRAPRLFFLLGQIRRYGGLYR